MRKYCAVIIGGTGFEGLSDVKETSDGPYADFKKSELGKYAKLYDVSTPKGLVLAVNRQPKIKQQKMSGEGVIGYETNAENFKQQEYEGNHGNETNSETSTEQDEIIQVRGYETNAGVLFDIMMPYLEDSKLDTVRAISAVGGLYETSWIRRLLNKYVLGRKNVKMKVGDVVAVRDHIDLWQIAKNEGFADYWHGANLYDKELTDELITKNKWIVDGGVYFCSRSNRFESPAEIELVKTVGANLVGMTMPRESNEARKRGKKFAGLGIVTNGAGIETYAHDHSQISAKMFESAFNAHMKTV